MDQFKLLNSVLDERASQGIERKAHDACRGLHLAGGTLLGFCADSERDLRWLWLPLGAPSGLSPSGLGSLKAVTEWVGSRVRDNRSQTAVTSYPSSTGSRARRDSYRVAFYIWLCRSTTLKALLLIAAFAA